MSAAPIVARVLKETEGKPLPEIRKALSKAYPFGQRKYHPDKIWLSECARQLGKKRMFYRVPGSRQRMSVDPTSARQATLDLTER